MCGIAGRYAAGPIDPDRLSEALNRLRFRGPDGNGHVALRTPGGASLDLLHGRLAVIDPDPRSNQPFVKDGFTLVFNGEIYNYRELRRELEEAGVRFRTEGDVEVLLEMLRRYGREACARLRGMYAFALYDEASSTLMLGRDPFGEKPLYFWVRDDGFYFGSEVKTLIGLAGAKPAIDREQLRRYLVNGYKGLMRNGTMGFFDEVKELPAGHVMVMTAPGEYRMHRHFRLSYDPQPCSAEEAVEAVRAALIEAVSLQLRADVPVAVRLSGGIDSNAIAGIAVNALHKDITCFSVVEDDWRYDETAMIATALESLDCPAHQIRIPRERFWERLGDMIAYFDGPPLTISYYLHYLVSEAIHEAGFKVALGGTGADEVFTGYYDHYLFWLAERSGEPDFEDRVAEWRATYGRFVRNPFLQDPYRFVNTPDARDHIFLGADRFSDYLTEPFEEPHREADLSSSLLRRRMLNELSAETVPVMLHDDDLASMRWSVENRAPFLDPELARLSFRIPNGHLVQDGLPKALLRKAVSGLAPEAILTNPRKQGINAPITSFVDFTDADVRDRVLEDDGSGFYDLVKRDKVEALLNSTVTLNSESKFLFSLVAARIFMTQYQEM